MSPIMDQTNSTFTKDTQIEYLNAVIYSKNAENQAIRESKDAIIKAKDDEIKAKDNEIEVLLKLRKADQDRFENFLRTLNKVRNFKSLLKEF